MHTTARISTNTTLQKMWVNAQDCQNFDYKVLLKYFLLTYFSGSHLLSYTERKRIGDATLIRKEKWIMVNCTELGVFWPIDNFEIIPVLVGQIHCLQKDSEQVRFEKF